MSTSEPYPLYNALRGTLLFEVNFTGRDYPLQKQPYVGREGEDDFIVIKRAAS